MIQIKLNSSLCSETTHSTLKSSLTSKWFNSTLEFNFVLGEIQFKSIQINGIESESIWESESICTSLQFNHCVYIMKNPTAWFSPKTCCSKTILSFDSKGQKSQKPKSAWTQHSSKPYENFLFNHIDLLYKLSYIWDFSHFQLTNNGFSALGSGLTDPCLCTHPLLTSFIMASSPYEYEKTSNTTYNKKSRLI